MFPASNNIHYKQNEITYRLRKIALEHYTELPVSPLMDEYRVYNKISALHKIK